MKKVYTSNIGRANETGELVQEELHSSLGGKEKIDLKIRSKLGFLDKEYFPKKVDREFRYYQKQGLPQEEFVREFLDGKWESQPEDLAKGYIFDMKRIFERVVKSPSKDSLKVVSFRHAEKNGEGDLTDTGRQQARELGRDLTEQKDETDNTIYLATHNMLNESIITTIFGRESLPKSWKDSLNFTETVEYTFLPTLNKMSGLLVISWRGKSHAISYEDFCGILEEKY